MRREAWKINFVVENSGEGAEVKFDVKYAYD